MTDLDELRYPIGRPPASPATSRTDQIETLRYLPDNLRKAVHGFSDAQLDTPYREGGWTVRQLVHHIADSHANAYFRFKLALTEDNPVIKPYDEAAWARLPDSRMPVDESLNLVQAVHARLVALLEAMSEEEFSRAFVHPERGPMTLAKNLSLYDWHSRHHLAHITRLSDRKGW